MCARDVLTSVAIHQSENVTVQSLNLLNIYNGQKLSC
jgi:hypothetical protein